MKFIKGVLVAFVILLTLTMAVGCRKKNPDPTVDRDSEGLVYTSNGDGSCYVSGIGDCRDTEIRIPDKSPEGETVVGIGDEAFSQCCYITSVTMPETVTSIGQYAFSGCISMKSVNVPGGVRSIGASAFIECHSLESINIPEGITTIEDACFSGCRNLVSVTIPSSVTSVGNFAFMSCSSLVEVVNKSSLEIKSNMTDYLGAHALNVITDESESRLTRTGDYVFYDDGNEVLLVKYLGSDSEIELPGYSGGNGYKIHRFAFHSNPYVTKVTIPEGVTEICDAAFENCLMLTSVVIPKSVTAVDEHAFFICYSLTEVVNKSSVSICDVDNVITDESESCVKRIGDYVFYDDANIVKLVKYLGREKNVTLPEYEGKNYVIDQWAFTSEWSASGVALESVVIPDSVTAIETYAFSSCRALKDVKIGNGVREIAEGAFGGCIRIENIWLGNSVYKIDSSLLTESRELLGITVAEGNPNYKSVDGNLLSKDGKTFIRFAVAKADATLVIPKGVTKIDRKAVQSGRNLTTVILPEGVISIGERAFYECGGITKLVLPSGLETVAKYSFTNLAPEELDGSLVHKVYFTGTEEEYKTLRRNNSKYENGLPYMAVYDYVIEE